jgi:Protein of unknown function (DUF3383)
MSTIPASELVNVIPSVLPVGGTGLEMIALMLTDSTRIPSGTVAEFSDAESVSDYFGPSAAEFDLATVYFDGFEGRTKVPGSLLMAQYNSNDVAAFIRGNDVSSLSVAELQAISGTLTLTIDGYARVDASIDLSGAASLSAAAAQIQSEINAAITQEAEFTASITGTTMTVTAVASGTLGAGQTVSGGTVDAGTYIVQQLSGTEGDTGTYEVSVSQSEGSGTLTSAATPVAVTYDSISGGFLITSGVVGAISTVAFPSGTLAVSLSLTSATGAVLSQGADAASPGTFMDALVAVNRAWATFMTTFDPDSSGNTVKLAFAEWTSDQDNDFAYVCWDTDSSPTTQAPAAASLGALIDAAQYSGTNLNYTDDAELAAFVCGVAASIDFDATNGRADFAYKRQDGLVAGVSSNSVKTNLEANGYNYYGVYGARADQFTWYQRGTVSGDFMWLDSFINQIWLNDMLQVALLDLLGAVKSIPFSTPGYTQIENAFATVIATAKNFGAFGPATIAASQAQSVNAAAGLAVAEALQSEGYYLQVVAASAAVRAARGPLSINFWYIDRGSVQKITVNSVAVQ